MLLGSCMRKYSRTFAGSSISRSGSSFASQEPGLPGGLFLGTTVLSGSVPAGEERELRLDPGVDPADVRTLFVRRENDGEAP